MAQSIATAGARFQLLTIHRERIKRDVCHIGKLLRSNQRSFTLRDISTQAEWDEEETYQVRDITALEFDGMYERLLYQLAPPEPRQIPKDPQ